MAVTVIGRDSARRVSSESTPLVQYAAAWGEGWQTIPELELEMATVRIPELGASEARVRWRYGELHHPHEQAVFSNVRVGSWLGGWLRIGFAESAGESFSFVGRVVRVDRLMRGNNGTLATGDQILVARGPLELLRRAGITWSYWERSGSGEVQRLAWVPDFNAADRYGLTVGNRSSAKADGSYVFGGSETWTRLQMLEHVLDRYASTGGIAWTVSGQADLLSGAADSVQLSNARNAEEAVSMLIDPSLGVSWKIEPTPDGFAVHVFALLGEEVSFGDVVLPSNPARLDIVAGDDPHVIRSTLSVSRSNRFGTIRVVGSRVVVCFSLRGADLVGKWTTAQETAYLAGTGTPADEAIEHDQARLAEQLRPVFSAFGAPASFDMEAAGIVPTVNPDGSLDSATPADHQTVRRETLRWTPLRNGYDYSTNPPTATVPTGHVAEHLPPAAWIRDPSTLRHVPVELLEPGIGVSVPVADWGVILNANPAHRVALNHWTGAADTYYEPEFDYSTLIATVAYATDQRLRLEWTAEENDGSVLELEAAGAELHYVAPGTVLGVNRAGELVTAGQGLELRNDTARLGLVMAGAIARHGRDRATAEVTMRGLHAWAGLLGTIMGVVDEGGDVDQVGAPVVSVTWRGGNQPQTIISAGVIRGG